MARKKIKNKNLVTKVEDPSLQIRESGEITSSFVDNPSKEQIISELEKGECTLFFYKMSDGKFRRMRCTLTEEKPIPSKYNRQGVVVVWDLDANQWRSFYPNRVFKLVRDEDTDAL